jgi:hypothetical protein
MAITRSIENGENRVDFVQNEFASTWGRLRIAPTSVSPRGIDVPSRLPPDMVV